MVEFIASKDAAMRLVEEILDVERTTPLVGVSMSSGRERPLIEVDQLSAGLAGRATVHVVVTGEATWELKRLLPAGLDVYGDALRVWQPGVRAGETADHLLLLLDGLEDPPALVGRVIELVDQGTHRERAAVVHEVRPDQAVLRLTDGAEVLVPAGEVTRHRLAAPQVLRPAQAVRVLILQDSPAGSALRGSMLPFEPDPWRRLVEGYGPGAVLVGRVSRLHNYGAFVELLPGVVGLLRVGRIAEHWVGHPSDELVLDELVTVRVLELDGARAELSMRGLADVAAAAASLLPDGPPWLVPPSPATELPALEEHAAALSAWEAPAEHGIRYEWSSEVFELDRLEELVLQASDVHHRSRRLIGDAVQRVGQLRTQADELRHELEMDLIELRGRVLRAVEDEHAQIQGSTQEALDEARREIRRLRALLAAVGRERGELEDQAREAGEQARRTQASLREARTEAERQRAKARRIEAELDTFVPAEDRLRAAIRASWLRNTRKADRERYRWREPVIGPDLLRSLELIEGIGRERVVDVCAEVVSGRAVTRTGLQVHPLRATDAGGSSQQVRADGARAYRASLQVRSAAARRLHYWELSDGGVELAKVGYHDDFTIR